MNMFSIRNVGAFLIVVAMSEMEIQIFIARNSNCLLMENFNAVDELSVLNLVPAVF